MVGMAIFDLPKDRDLRITLPAHVKERDRLNDAASKAGVSAADYQRIAVNHFNDLPLRDQKKIIAKYMD